MRRVLIPSLFAFLITSNFAFSAPITQVGLGMDGSSSISSSDFNIMRNSMSNALLAVIPTNSTVEITVVQFSSSAHLIVAPTLINSAATLNSVRNAILGMSQFGGTTNTAGAISMLTTQLTGSSNFNTPGSRQAINILTDGNPNVGSPNGQAAAEAAALAAVLAGVDELDLEAIGSNINIAGMLAIAQPGPGHLTTSPAGFSPGFVLPVAGFTTELDIALQAKLRAVISVNETVPEPTSIALFGVIAAGGAIYRWRSRKSLAAA